MKNAWVFAGLLLLGCGDSALVVERAGKPAVVNFDDHDAEMAEAIQQARDSAQGFISELPALRQGGDYFSVKVPIEGASGTEHVWLDSPELANGSFHGTIGNDPLGGPFELGDRVSTPLSEISDWMAVRGGELYGGFTIVVARSRMSPKQRDGLDASLGFRVPESARSFQDAP